MYNIFGLFLFLVTSWSGGFAASNLSVFREGSGIRADWTQGTEGAWALRVKSGENCVTGTVYSDRSSQFIPKVAADRRLEFEVTAADGVKTVVEMPPLDKRSGLDKPVGTSVIYQLPVRTWLATGVGRSRTGKFSDLSVGILRRIKDLGVDYLWVTGAIEYASPNKVDPDVVKGDAGSYYAISDSWDVSGNQGDLAEFDLLIDRVHSVGLRILIDLVPNHTARKHKTDVVCKRHLDYASSDDVNRFFSPMNNYFYITGSEFYPPYQPGTEGSDGVFDTNIFAEGIQPEFPARATGNDIASSSPDRQDWYETAKLNYGYNFISREESFNPVPKTWTTIIDIARYWLLKGVDGFRIDFAHVVPVPFWKFFVQKVREVQPQAFILAEAYESDHRMKVPGFSYRALYSAGFDSIYNSGLYWSLRSKIDPNHVSPVGLNYAGFQPYLSNSSVDFVSTHYLENHDEIRLASRFFAKGLQNEERKAELGYSLSVWSALQPANFLIHGGQELRESARVFGAYAGDNGRTSIFDYVYQDRVKSWLDTGANVGRWGLRSKYRRLLSLKHEAPFNLPNRADRVSYQHLAQVNASSGSEHVMAYTRFSDRKRYLVVVNLDPYSSHRSTIHFTRTWDQDSDGVLRNLQVENSRNWYRFTEVLNRPGWVPTDPEFGGKPGVPGWALYKPHGVPSGLYLGEIPAGTTYVFELISESVDR